MSTAAAAAQIHQARTSPAAGTVAELSRATLIPRSTINAYARDGDITPIDRILVGRRWVARYDGRELMRISRMRHRRNGKRILDVIKSNT